MKKILILIILVTTSITNAQINYDKWETNETVDEFGDKTGQNVETIILKGKFSNSATTNSDLTVRVIDYGNLIQISLFEYDKSPEVKLSNSATIGIISIKRENGDIERFKTFTSKNGVIQLIEQTKLPDIIRNGKGEVLKVLIDESKFNKYGKSTYSFNLITKN